MREPLPEGQAGRRGWPWTADGELPHAECEPGLPRVSVVTPSYNQGDYVEETIRSVLLQDYGNLECIVMDGGSTDSTIDVLRRYSPHLDHWQSGPDGGHASAVNKGWSIATGEILAFLNSDDLLLPGAVTVSVAFLRDHPECDLVHANAFHIDEQGLILNRNVPSGFDTPRLIDSCFVTQPTVFMRRSLLDEVGGLDEALRFVMDYEYWLRASAVTTLGYLPAYTAAARYYRDARSASQYNRFPVEEIDVFDRLFSGGTAPYAGDELTRRAYLPRLLYIAGKNSQYTPEQKSDALERLSHLRPTPSRRELLREIEWHDAILGTVYRPLDTLKPSGSGTSDGPDVYGILDAVVEAGLVSPDVRTSVRQELSDGARLRHAVGGAEQHFPDRERELLQIAGRRPRLVLGRSWWVAQARAVGRLLPASVRQVVRRVIGRTGAATPALIGSPVASISRRELGEPVTTSRAAGAD